MNEADYPWQDLSGTWDRLRWARTRWQRKAGAVNGNAEDAAIFVGMKGGTYRAYERPPESSKHTKLDHQSAIHFGKRFRVSWRWLLLGEGTPDDDKLPETQERVVEAMTRMGEDQQQALAAMAEALLHASRTGTDG